MNYLVFDWHNAHFNGEYFSDHQVKEMQRLLMEVQAEKERLIRSLAAGSVENMITSSDDQTCGQVQGSIDFSIASLMWFIGGHT